ISFRGEDRSDFGKAVDVVWPSVKQKDSGTACRSGLGVADIQKARIDLFQLIEGRSCSSSQFSCVRRRSRLTPNYNSRSRKHCRRQAKEIATMMIVKPFHK